MVMPYLSQKHPQGRPFWKDVKAYNDNWRRQEVPTTFGTGFLPVLHVDRRSHRLHTISIRSTSRLEPLSMHTFGVPLVLVCELAIDRDLATRFFDLQPEAADFRVFSGIRQCADVPLFFLFQIAHQGVSTLLLLVHQLATKGPESVHAVRCGPRSCHFREICILGRPWFLTLILSNFPPTLCSLDGMVCVSPCNFPPTLCNFPPTLCMVRISNFLVRVDFRNESTHDVAASRMHVRCDGLEDGLAERLLDAWQGVLCQILEGECLVE